MSQINDDYKAFIRNITQIRCVGDRVEFYFRGHPCWIPAEPRGYQRGNVTPTAHWIANNYGARLDIAFPEQEQTNGSSQLCQVSSER